MSKALTTEQFIEKAIKVHGDLYCYSKVKYLNTYTKVIIICPVHGEFKQRPNSHLAGSHCDKCARILKASKNKINIAITTKEFIKKAKLVHGNIYDYSKVDYKTAQNKITIICPEHGEFSQVANSHLRGCGCKKCAYKKLPQNQPLTRIEFINNAKAIHGTKYNYDNTVYTKAINKVKILCNIHGEFSIKAQSHIEGVGCPGCTIYGFNPNKPAILYYLKITTEDNQTLYKIGITNKTVNERFSLLDLNKIEIIKQEKFENGKEAYDKEQKILKKYSKFKYKGPKILESGNTELFNKDVLTMYYND